MQAITRVGDRSVIRRNLRNFSLLLVIGAAVIACGSHQAPVSEQSQRQVRAQPLILSSTNGSENPRISVSQPDQVLSVDSRPQIISSNSASRNSTPAATVTRAAPQQTQSLVRRPVGSVSNQVSDQVRNQVSRSARSAVASAAGSVGSAVSNSVARPFSHLVSAGDTLFSIAFQYDLDFRTLAMANGLTPPYTIFVGQELRLQQALAEAAIDAVGNGIESGIRSRVGGGESSGIARQPVPAPMPSEPNWQWPLGGRVLNSFQPEITKGIDIAGIVGDPVLAAAAGDVVYSGRGVQGTGNLIIIRHTDQYLSAYAHNSAMLVPEGTRVFAGEKIAEVGVDPAGVPMLHFEIRRDGVPIDPTQFLPRR